ncbi:nucleotidyltransferase family protein [Marinobacterium rhizophilum]|uniref:Nucleotidyltransferase family protein n=1 Tax=Marinobacterium rhizophilum TaxID=420402 RepID=A0ABY5HDF1_9GAMM|nr:nucleotidyltransferase family protein [Marinobacterium rhizophilum]UTW10149.1 nucleotidyltransferase family protein [Marinobacterium rhizophilum]
MEDGNGAIALVMAAGRARRFGADKRCEMLLPDCTLLQATVQSMAAAFDSVRVVIRSDDDPAELGLESAMAVVRSPRADQGLGLSIADGFSTLHGSQATAAAVLLGDMPCIAPGTFTMLIEQAAADRIVRPEYQGHAGHPVIFGRNFWGELSQLQDEEGARSVIQRHPEACMRIKVDDPGVLMDADRPEDLEALRARYQGMRGSVS